MIPGIGYGDKQTEEIANKIREMASEIAEYYKYNVKNFNSPVTSWEGIVQDFEKTYYYSFKVQSKPNVTEIP